MEGTTIATMLTSAGETIVSGLDIVWNVVTGNTLLTLFVGASVLSMSFGFFRKAKRAAR